MTIDLSECRAKIERAHEHRELLESELAAIFEGESESFKVSAKLDPQSGNHVFRVSEVPEGLLLRMGVILGDVIHNLRSSLEYLFWGLCYLHLGVEKTERLGDNVQFPIVDWRQTLINKRDHFRKIPERQWTIIRDAQPYHGRYDPSLALRLLRDLSNRDKHRALNPVPFRTRTLVVIPELINARPRKVMRFKDFGKPKRLEVGIELLEVRYLTEVDPEVKVAGYTTARVMLPEGNLRLVEGADLMIDTVRTIVNNIEAEL